MVILIAIAVAVGLFCVGLLFKASRRLIGALLLFLGLLACLTGIGFIIGLPVIFIGAVILYLEYGGRRRLRHHPHII